jgi:hypothetical protein
MNKYLLLFVAFLLFFASCEEEKRFAISSDDTDPPAPPVYVDYKPLNGGARLFFRPPADEDVLSIDAVAVNKGKSYRFSVSYFSDSLDVYALSTEEDYTVQLFAVDRAGNKSSMVPVTVRPLESAYSKVAKSLVAKAGFDAIFVDWKNELGVAVNVFVEYSFEQNGVKRDLLSVFVSSDTADRRYIADLDLDAAHPVSVKVRVGDQYENFSETLDFGKLVILKDVKIPKFDAEKNPLWSMPQEKMEPPFGGGARQVVGYYFDGKNPKVIDDLIDRDNNLNYLLTDPAQEEYEWNVIINLGDYYELSRIVTHQRWQSGADVVTRGGYYRESNVGHYRMYRWDEETMSWEVISEHKIPIPKEVSSDIQWMQVGRAGDEAYMYPDEPGYTKPTRWFRYQALHGFLENYTSIDYAALSEITLFAKQK